MNKCKKCGTEFEGNCCPKCGTWADGEKTCPKCGAKLKADANFCNNCGFSFGGAPENNKPQKIGGSFKGKFAKLSKWIKTHLKIVIPAAVAVLLVIILACSIPACVKGKDNGTYYKLKSNGEIDKKTYFVIDSGEWKDEDGESGTYKKDGDKIVFYIEFFGSTEEAGSGTLKDGVLIMDEGGAKQSYISENHKHNFGKWETVRDVSCTIDGLEQRACECGVKETYEIKCVGHHTGDWKTEKDSTCIQKGLKTMTCTVCNKKIEEEIDYAEHALGDWLSDGDNHYKICSVCENKFYNAKHDKTDGCSVCGYPFEFKSLYGGYEIKTYKNKAATALIIPATFNGKSVVSIGSEAFSDCANLTGITIPNSVTSIGWDAFRGCAKLIQTESGEISYVDKWVIDCKGNVIALTLKSNTIGIGDEAFRGCAALKSITIPDSVTTIGERAFYNCSSLTSITIPDSVTSIGGSAFYDCSSLTEIKFKDITSYCQINGLNNIDKSKVYIGEQKLQEMTSITIPDGVTSIGYSTFEGCSSLTSVTIPDSVTNIGISAFSDCSSLTSVTIPDSVKSIGAGAFYGCNALTSVTIGNSVKSIGDSAFNGCSRLTNIIIPDSVIIIGGLVFSHCSSLTSITIPNSVTNIGWEAFCGCSSLTSIIIPDRVSSIDSYAFDGCSSLTIYCEAESKPSGWSSSWNSSNRPVVWGYKG